jgi:T5orf172 domain
VTELNDDELLEALGAEAPQIKFASFTAREERIIAGFEDILKFQQSHGRVPQHGDDRDIFERIYAVRLDQIRKLPEAIKLLKDLDQSGLLTGNSVPSIYVDDLDEDELLVELGASDAPIGNDDISVLRNVRPYAEIQAAEEYANRTPCLDFNKFKPLFDRAISGLKNGTWMTKPFVKNASIAIGDYFIINGQTAYVAEMNEGITTKDGRDNPRLRVIFDNKTESNLLLRSLSRSLYPDGDMPVGRRIIPKDDGPLFGDTFEPEDIESGSIYVLRSLSKHPFIAQHSELIHKIGVTGGKVETRISNAENDPTYLLAGVKIIATYQLSNINRLKLEKLIHHLFAPAQIDLTIEDRFGKPVKPREWFLVPLHVINEAVERIRDGSISDMLYDPKTASLISSNI